MFISGFNHLPALVAAQNANRRWIGVDISPTACRVMAKRLVDKCGIRENEKLWKIGRGFVVRAVDRGSVAQVAAFEFENWV
jgi:hypothetical protein